MAASGGVLVAAFLLLAVAHAILLRGSSADMAAKQPVPQWLEHVYAVQAYSVAKGRQDPRWQKRRKWLTNPTRAVGHDVGHERSCEGMIDWIALLGAIVVPRLKLAFCWVPKVACTDFNGLMNALNGLNLPAGSADCGFSSYMASSPGRMGYPKENVTRENGWKFAAFTRDPLERYAAVYGFACMPSHMCWMGHYANHRACCGDLVPEGAPNATARESFERRALADAAAGLPAEEAHWSPQVELLENCGWDNFAPERLDFAGSISVGDVPRQVKDMIRLVNGTNADVELVDIFFPQGEVSGHRNSIANDYRSFYAKAETIAAVKHVYQADYALIPGIGRGFTEETSVVATTPSAPAP
mmetsp:Transcript_96/g.262  ORF Transcript_96/g.262 Transcript_96/m.262 type:complete len:357 (-) Transcript_96:168-1238(-)